MAFIPATVAMPKPPAMAITNLITAVEVGADTSTTTRHGDARRPPTPTTATTDHRRPPRHDDHAGGDDQVRAVVLVGGEGTRLRPLTLTTPKQMLPIVEQPMIERVIGHLADHGIDDAVLSLGYRPDAFIDAYPDGTIAGVRLTYAVEPTPLDTAGAIRFAAGHGGIDETFVVVNGDVLTDSDLTGLVEFHRSPRCRGHHQLDAGRGPERIRRGPHRRRGPGRGLHREAIPRRSANQPDQCRDLRLRALRPRPHPR